MHIFILGVLLVGCFFTWIYWVTDGKISYSEILTCEIYLFFLYWFRHSSVWILTIMSGERCMSLIFPFKAKTFSTIRVAKIISALTIVFWGIFNFQLVFVRKTVKRSTQNPDGCAWHMSKKHYYYYMTLYNVFYSLLPCILIFICNMIIIFRLLLAKFRSKQSGQTSAVSKNAMNTSLMLLSVSVSFFILTSPIAIYYFIFLNYSAIQEMLYLTIYLYYTNHSCNALMYTVISSKFRREVKRCLCNTANTSSSEGSAYGHGNRIGPSDTNDSM